MENKKDNYSEIYFNKAVQYSSRGFLLGGITSFLFFSKIIPGAVVGTAIGLGYCHKEFKTMYENVFNTINQNKFE